MQPHGAQALLGVREMHFVLVVVRLEVGVDVAAVPIALVLAEIARVAPVRAGPPVMDSLRPGDGVLLVVAEAIHAHGDQRPQRSRRARPRRGVLQQSRLLGTGADQNFPAVLFSGAKLHGCGKQRHAPLDRRRSFFCGPSHAAPARRAHHDLLNRHRVRAAQRHTGGLGVGHGHRLRIAQLQAKAIRALAGGALETRAPLQPAGGAADRAQADARASCAGRRTRQRRRDRSSPRRRRARARPRRASATTIPETRCPRSRLREGAKADPPKRALPREATSRFRRASARSLRRRAASRHPNEAGRSRRGIPGERELRRERSPHRRRSAAGVPTSWEPWRMPARSSTARTRRARRSPPTSPPPSSPPISTRRAPRRFRSREAGTERAPRRSRAVRPR